MLKTYINIALRNLYKERVYAAINIFGLGLAIACCFLISLYVHSELSVDKHNAGHDRIVRLVKNLSIGGQPNFMAATSPQIAPLVLNNYPDIGEYVRFQSLTRRVFRHEDVSQYWDGVYIADENALEFFSHDILYGDSGAALVEPDSIVISESFARAFFGDRNPLNEILYTDTSQYRVTAVFRDLPRNSHFRYSALLSRNLLESDSQAFLEQATPMNLVGTYIYTYFKLPDTSMVDRLEVQVNEFADQYAAAALAEQGMAIEYFVQPLTKIHYDDRWSADLPTGNIFYLYGLSAVAVFIFLIACINYTNISIARATARRDEINMHKILGAKRTQLATSFLIESLLHVVCALIFGMVCIELASTIPELNDLVSSYSSTRLAGVLVLLTLVTGVLAGAYPAYCLSAYRAGSASRLQASDLGHRITLQKFFIFTQFTVSIAIIIATLLMSFQLQYVANKPLGFDPKNRIMVDLTGAEVIERLPALREQLLDNPDILSVAEASHRLDSGRQGVPNYAFDIENHEGVMESIALVLYEVGPDYLTLMDIELAEGRDFRAGIGSESDSSLIVNEALVRRMGWSSPIGRKIGDEQQVIGVITDFHLDSLHRPVLPLILQVRREQDLSRLSPAARSGIRQVIYIELAENNISEALNHVEDVLTDFQPDRPFEFKFFSDALAEYYASDQSLVRTTGILAVVSILISSLGMLGVSALNLHQSIQEIGIRKVLGATAWQIVQLFVGRQIFLVLGGGLTASLISYYVISDWITTFVYRTDISFWIFPAAVLIVTFVAMGSVAIQSFLAARMNPVKSLRYE